MSCGCGFIGLYNRLARHKAYLLFQGSHLYNFIFVLTDTCKDLLVAGHRDVLASKRIFSMTIGIKSN